jgi:3-oxoacyl-[acyl-carrier protein] reductase
MTMGQPNIFVVPSAKELRDEASAPTASEFANFEKIKPGDVVEFTKTITAEDVEGFARLSGDRNPLHMDEKFAARTHFQRRVVHGMLVANYVSTLIGMHCPGPGALWSQQSFRWPAPVFIGDRISLTMKVRHKSEGARSLTLEVKALNQEGKLVMEGEGTVTALEERPQTADVPVSERVAFISGGARGLGAAIAEALARQGAMVIINYRKSALAAEELCSTIHSNGGRAIPVQADVTSQPSVTAAVEKARQEYKRPVSILVNNAGSLPEPRPFVQTSWEELQATFDVHVRGAFHCSQAVIPGMMEQKSGRIINIGSSFLLNTPPVNWSNFLVAKSAMQALTRCLAAELGPHGIRVNLVSPGLVETESIAGLSERLRKLQAMQTPLRRLASPSEIAAVVVALCSNAGDFVTGAEIPVSGGLQM